MMVFYSEIILPETKQICQVRQMTYEDYIIVNRFLQNDVSKHIQQCFIDLLHKYTNCKDFTGIDMLAALLFLRTISIGGTLKLTLNNTVHQVDIVGTLQKISDLELPKKNHSFGNITLRFQTPCNLIAPVYTDYIHSISVPDASRTFLLTQEERQQICDILLADILPDISDLAKQIDTTLQTVKVWIIDREVAISFEDLSAFDLLKLIFKDNVVSCQQRLLALVAGFELDTSYILGLPFAEVELLLSMLKERESAREESSKTSGIPLQLPSMM